MSGTLAGPPGPAGRPAGQRGMAGSLSCSGLRPHLPAGQSQGRDLPVADRRAVRHGAEQSRRDHGGAARLGAQRRDRARRRLPAHPRCDARPGPPTLGDPCPSSHRGEAARALFCFCCTGRTSAHRTGRGIGRPSRSGRRPCHPLHPHSPALLGPGLLAARQRTRRCDPAAGRRGAPALRRPPPPLCRGWLTARPPRGCGRAGTAFRLGLLRRPSVQHRSHLLHPGAQALPHARRQPLHGQCAVLHEPSGHLRRQPERGRPSADPLRAAGRLVQQQIQQTDQAAAADYLTAVDHASDLGDRNPLDPVGLVQLGRWTGI